MIKLNKTRRDFGLKIGSLCIPGLSRCTAEERTKLRRSDLLMEYDDLRLLLCKNTDLEQRIKQSISVIDLSSGMGEHEEIIGVKVDCNTNLRMVIEKSNLILRKFELT